LDSEYQKHNILGNSCGNYKEKKPVIEAQMTNRKASQPGLVALAYNPVYSGGRDQEDCHSKPSQIVGDPVS
jgi:hypothetical protein